MKKSLPLFSIVLMQGISALVSAQESGEEANQSAQTCEVVKTLIGEHKTGFKSLRGARTETTHMVIFKAKHDVVGDGCEIWESGDHSMHYVCTRSSPSKAVADDYYKTARERAHACLDESWKESEAARKEGGIKTVFKKPGVSTSVELHKVKVEGFLKDQWTIYYVIGDAG